MPKSTQPQEDVPASSSSEESQAEEPVEEYVVEEIRASRWDATANGQRFLVKWKGYSENEKTWEPAENLLGCQDLVREFEKAKAERERKRQQAQSLPPVPAQPVLKKAIPPPPPSSDDSSADEGVGMQELVVRREQAKKKKRASSAQASQAGQVEDAVAKKWEKKAQRKDTKNPSTTVKAVTKAKDPGPGKTTFKKSPAKQRSEDAPAGKATAAKRARDSTGGTSPGAKKVKKAPRVAVDSDEEDTPPLVRKKAPATVSLALSLAAVAAPSTSSSHPQPKKGFNIRNILGNTPPVSSKSTAKTSLSASTASGSSTSNGNSLSTTVKPKPALQPALPPPVEPSGERSPSPVPPPPQHVGPSHPRPPAEMRSSLKSLSFKKRAASPAVQNGAGTTGAGVTSAAISPAPPSQAPAPTAPVAPTAEELAAKVKRARDQLAGHEDRLRRTWWCANNPIFQQPLALPLLCVQALHIEPHMLTRMKNRGVAILFDMQSSERAKGEGHALGYCLLAVGADTPQDMSSVQAVCLHRTYPLDNIEGLYCELTNLTSHTVEFFLFGDDQPLQPILTHGYLVIVLRSALQQSAALERFCYNVHESYHTMCTLRTHPATLAAVRQSLPNWNTTLNVLPTNGIDVVDRSHLSLNSAFVTIEKSSLLSPNTVYPAIPTVNDDVELDEVASYLSWARSQDPSRYRRFVVVTGEITDEPQGRLRAKGIELATWATLSEMMSKNHFG
ncbi:hypothetical protein JCM11641_005441 [Rhodosporidiobolus odoratus]